MSDRDHRALLRGHRIAYGVEGDQGSPVLLIMGFGMSGRAWRPVFEAQREAHRVCWYDARGLGDSSEGDDPTQHCLEGLAADAVALMDHLGWSDAHVAGVSMGGMVAQHVALSYRPRVRSLTLIATHAGGGMHRVLPSPRGLALFALANIRRGEGRLRALQALLYSPEGRAGAMAQVDPQDLATLSRPASATVRRNHLASILRHDTRAALHALEGLPTLVIKPGGDVLVPPACSDELARRVPGARLVTFPRAGHGVLREEAAAVNAAMSAFWDDVDAT